MNFSLTIAGIINDQNHANLIGWMLATLFGLAVMHFAGLVKTGKSVVVTVMVLAPAVATMTGWWWPGEFVASLPVGAVALAILCPIAAAQWKNLGN